MTLRFERKITASKSGQLSPTHWKSWLSLKSRPEKPGLKITISSYQSETSIYLTPGELIDLRDAITDWMSEPESEPEQEADLNNEALEILREKLRDKRTMPRAAREFIAQSQQHQPSLSEEGVEIDDTPLQKIDKEY